MKKRETSPSTWAAHRKARKKIASAKWYAKKKKKEIKEQNMKRKELNNKIQEKMCQRIWTEQQYWEWRSVLAYHAHWWPMRPHDIPARDWCCLLDWADSSVRNILSRMGMANTAATSKVIVTKQLCMRELAECYRTHGLEEVSARIVAERKVEGSSSQWEHIASQLSQSAFPVATTPVGMLFVQLFCMGQSHRWAEVCRGLYQTHVIPPSTTSVQTHGANPPHTMPPSQKPTVKTVELESRIQQMWQQLLREEEDASRMEHDHSNSSITVPPSLDSFYD